MTPAEEHPITPPPELVQEWLSEPRYSSLPKDGTFVVKQCQSLADDEISNLVTKAARWGADQELEACITWVAIESLEAAKELRAARRPKPPSLKEKGLAGLAKLEAQGLCPDLVSEIRRALEQLDD